MKKLVIVESPGKSKTIEGYLGKDYKVVASIGHLRHLPSIPGAVQFDDGFKFQWEIEQKKFNNIAGHLKSANEILIATDMDREGEAIAWHLKELISEKDKNISIKRISFIEITETAIKDSLKHVRDVDGHLVNAYFTRIGLDYSIGFGISPVIRQKMMLKNQSAGRVQSPALKLIVHREFERMKFVKEEYYSITGEFEINKNIIFGVLIQWNNKKLPTRITKKIEADKMLKLPKQFVVSEINKKKVSIKAPAPFITSTLQKESGIKLGFKVVHTMKIAQQLYEGVNLNGKSKALITYMRTDSTNMSKDSIENIRKYIKSNYSEYLPAKHNIYKSKVKNAQEAHECIRTTDITIDPYHIKDQLTIEQFKLYTLIWKQSLMSQMKPAIREQVSFFLEANGNVFKSNASRIDFWGFMYINQYLKSQKNKDNKTDDLDDQDSTDIQNIPLLEKGMQLSLKKAEIITHETKPPARFSESTLVTELEKYGIGRPSTYPNIIETLLKREYVIVKDKTLMPSIIGQIIATFLELCFTNYVEYQYTAQIEDLLDEIANGKGNYQNILKELLDNLDKSVAEVVELQIAQIFNRIGEFLSEKWNKKCTTCGSLLKLRKKFDFFMTCINCNTLYKIDTQQKQEIGTCQYIKTEKYAYLLQNDNRVYLPQRFNTELSEEKIKFLFSLPLKLRLKNDGKEAMAAMSKYGFYIKIDKKYKNYKDLDLFIKFVQAQEIIDDFKSI